MDLDTLEHVSLRTLGGADIVTADDLAGTDVKTFDVDLQAITGTGDGSADSVVVRGTDSADSLKLVNVGDREAVDGLAAQTRVSGDEAADAIRVEGLDGADTFTSSVAVHGQIPVHFTGGDGQDTAAYNGSDQADEIGIARDATEAAVFATGAATTLVDPTVESLIVSGLDGNDTIAGQNGLATITALTLQGGDGDDDLRGGDGADTLIGGKGDDHVDGNIGADTAFLGTGDDHFQWDPGDGSDTVEGQAGNDTLDFNGSNAGEQIELTANGNRLRLTRNVANITMDTDSIEHVNLRTLGGADTVTIGDLAGTDVKTVDVDLQCVRRHRRRLSRHRGRPRHGRRRPTECRQRRRRPEDRRRVRRREVSSAMRRRMRSASKALDGADTFTSSVAVHGQIPVHFDRRRRPDTAAYNGSDQADEIGIARDATEAAVFATGAATSSSTDRREPDRLRPRRQRHDRRPKRPRAPSPHSPCRAATATTTCAAATEQTRCSAAKATTTSTATSVPTPHSLAAATTTSSGIPATAATPSKARTATTRSTSTAPTSANRSGSPPTATASASPATSPTSRSTPTASNTYNIRTLGGADTATIGDLAGTDVNSVDVDLERRRRHRRRRSRHRRRNPGFAGGAMSSRSPRSGAQVTVAGFAAETTITGSEPTLDTLRVERSPATTNSPSARMSRTLSRRSSTSAPTNSWLADPRATARRAGLPVPESR